MPTESNKELHQSQNRRTAAAQKQTQIQKQTAAQKRTRTSAPGPTSTGTAAVSTGNQPTEPWRQRCLIVILAFPCVGKSSLKDELAKVAGAEKWKVHDVDSATYGIKDSTAALLKYLSEIRKQAAIPGAIVLGSAHDVVQLGLFYLGVKFIRVRPRGDAKATFLAREKKRHPENGRLHKLMDTSWGNWIRFEEFMNLRTGAIIMRNDQFLSNAVIQKLNKDWVPDWEAGGTERYAAKQEELKSDMRS